MKHPKTTPLNEWTDGWLVMEVANLLDVRYVIMTEEERRQNGYPANREERISYIAFRRGRQ